MLKDSNYLKGMNSVDDPKTLQDGECVEIVNAIPDQPLRLRKGCEGKILFDTDTLGWVTSKPFYASFRHGDYVFFWIQGGLYSALVSKGAGYGVAEEVRYELPDAPPFVTPLNDQNGFDFVRIGDIVYTRIDQYNPNFGGSSKMFAIDRYEAGAGGPRGFRGRVIPIDSFDNNPKFADSSPRYDINSGSKVFKGNFAFGYSLALIRRTGNIPANAYAPGVIESPEIPSERRSVMRSDSLSDSDTASIYIRLTSVMPHINVFGFTHVRVYRTHNLYLRPTDDGSVPFDTDAERQQFIGGATRYWLMDIPISTIHLFSDEVEDTVSEGALLGETNQLTSYNYTFPPIDGYRMLYFKDRLFLMGWRGNVFFSEIPGGSGGSDLEFSQVQSDKYALWFKPLHYRIELDPEEATLATGLDHFGGDLYLFKQNKVYMIISGDPVSAPLRIVSDKNGCLFSNTISRAILFGQEVLFYLGSEGPSIISIGGNFRPLTEFKIKELWPETESRLFSGAHDPFENQGGVHQCSSAFWNNTLWVFFQMGIKGMIGKNFEDTKIFGFRSLDEVNGAFEIKLAELGHKYNINSLAITNDNRAIAISNMTDFVPHGWAPPSAIVNFLSSDLSYDTFDDGVAPKQLARPVFNLLSREIYSGPLERNVSELFRLVGYCNFMDDLLHGRPFLLDIVNNRYKASYDYYARNTVFQSNQLGKPIPGTTAPYWFTRSDVGEWKPGTLLGYVAYIYHENYPEDGIWVSVLENTQTGIHVDAILGIGTYAQVRLIARPIIRRNVEFVPQADFIGEFFQYRVTKIIPPDGKFYWYGAELETILRPQLNSENQVGGSYNINSWEERHDEFCRP